ncbi:hypothetical protein D3C80_1287160 [compost metagenome]
MPCLFVVALDQQPVFTAFTGLSMHTHKMPTAFKLFALQFKFEMAFAVAFLRVANRAPDTTIPKNDGAAAILAFRDYAFEVAVA